MSILKKLWKYLDMFSWRAGQGGNLGRMDSNKTIALVKSCSDDPKTEAKKVEMFLLSNFLVINAQHQH